MKDLALRDWLTGGFAVVLILAVVYLWLSPAGIQPAPALQANALNMQRNIDLASLRGRPVLVTFWATSCPGCIKEMPHLIDLYKELQPRGFEIVSVAMSYDRPDHILNMANKKQIPYPIIYDGTKSIAQAFGDVSLTPTNFLINPDGQIVKHMVGEMDMKLLHAQILTMLNSRVSQASKPLPTDSTS